MDPEPLPIEDITCEGKSPSHRHTARKRRDKETNENGRPPFEAAAVGEEERRKKRVHNVLSSRVFFFLPPQ